MRKRIAFISLLGLVVLAGYNNCGEGFQGLNLDESTLSSNNTINSGPALLNQVQINLILEPAAVTYKAEEKIEYEVTNLTDTDQISCKLNSALLDNCDSPLEFTNLTDGTQKLEILVNNGKCETCFVTLEWNVKMSTVDSTPINVTLASAPETETESTTATFTFSFSEVPNSMKCKLNGNEVIDCSNPQVFNEIPEGDNSFEIIVTDAANNETKEIYDWKVIKKDPEPEALVLDFQFDESGKGLVKYNKPLEQDITFRVDLTFDAPVRNFLRVLYEETSVPFKRDIGFTIKAGSIQKEFSFEEVLRPVLDLNGNIPEKVNIKAELYSYSGFKSNLHQNKVINYSYVGNPDAIKAAYGSINYAVFLSNSNQVVFRVNRGRTCQTSSLAFTSENYPVLISNGGANIFYILTNKNEIWKHDCLSPSRSQNPFYKLPENIKVKEISASHTSFVVLSDDNKAYVVSSAGHRQIFSHIQIKEIKMIHQNSSPADAVMIDTDNNVHLGSHRLRTSNSFSKENAFKLYSEVWNVFILYKNGNIASVDQIQDNKIDLSIPRFNPSSFVDWNQTNRKINFTSINSDPQDCSLTTDKKKVLKILTRGNICWAIGGTISSL